MKTEWGVSKSALTSWVRGKLYDGILSWCDEDGEEFSDEPALKKAKHSGNAYLKLNDSYNVDDVTGLPTPFELTKDPAWDVGGKLYHLYDLGLDRRMVLEDRAFEKVIEIDASSDEPEGEEPEEKDESIFAECTY